MKKGLFVIFLISSGLLGFLYFEVFNKPEEKSCVQKFAAFDIGSGTTKLKIAEVDVCKKKVLDNLIYMTMPVAYAQNLKENNGKFSKSIMEYGTKIMSRFINASKSYNVTQVMGVATSAFRKSSNGRKLIGLWNKKFSTKFRVIEQREEALIGYDSVRMRSNLNYAVWDIGGGSMQLVENAEGKPFVYLGNIASVTFKNEFMKKMRLKGASPNPIDKLGFEAAINLSMELFNEEVRKNKLITFDDDLMFIGIGGLHKSLLPKGKTEYSLNDMIERSKSYINKTDSQINSKYSDTMVTNIALIIGFMKLFKISKVKVMDVVLSDGLIHQKLMY